jgi:outer membrane protein assembly factor BamB
VASDLVYVGIKGGVVALDLGTGVERWRAPLKGGQFVTLLVDGRRVFASTAGEIFCLDAHSGAQLWHNKLPGMGLGLASLATAGASSSPAGPQEQQRRDADAAHTASG